MAITNAEIILRESQRLLQDGKLKPTGRVFKAELSDGSTITVNEAEPIHTFQVWKQMGFKVRKGEHAVTRLSIWKHGQSKPKDGDGEEEDRGYCFMKEACFFSASQVEPISEARPA